MLQIISGDDEHTAADGPYSRVLKTRKWLYLSSISAMAASNGLYDENAAKNLIKVIRVPEASLELGLSASIAYLLTQYVFVLLQLTTTYDLILRERFTSRRADEIAAAREKARAARRQYNEAFEAFRNGSSEALLRRLAVLNADLENR